MQVSAPNLPAMTRISTPGNLFAPSRRPALALAAAVCLAVSACGYPGAGRAAPSATGAATSGASAAPVPAGLEPFYSQTVSWAPCEDDDGFQCATVSVPLDYKDPAGRTISLALKKLPASGTSPIGSLFVNPGGPGGSGIDLVSQGAHAFSADLRAHYDIIGFDPRGVGASTPLTCLSPEEIKQVAQDPAGTQDAPAAKEAEAPEEESAQAALDSGRQAAEPCERHTPVPGLIDHMDTGSVARDLDVLRGLVGEERLTYLGTSYGTYLGARYAELFPGKVGRMVLDSAQDPAVEYARLRIDQAAALERTLRAYVEHCQKGGACPLSGGVEAGTAQLRDFFDRADAAPLPTSTQGVTIDGATARNAVGQTMYDETLWDRLTSALTAAIKDGDGTELAALSAPVTEEGQDPEAAASKEAAQAANGPAINAVDCLDYPVRGDQAQWDAQAAQTRKVAPTLGEGLSYPDAFCQGWGHHSDHVPAAVRAQGAAPILVVGVTGDPATPYEWAQSLASQLESGHLLTVRGNGHGAYMRMGSCVSSAVDVYLLRGELPEPGATCQARYEASAEQSSSSPAGEPDSAGTQS